MARIENEEVLERFRGIGRCDVCGKQCVTCPHHIIARGMGGGKRIDHPYNLLAVGANPFEDTCHRYCQSGLISQERQIQMVAVREGVSAKTVEEHLAWIARQDKNRPLGEVP